jgi:hypothetical protein
LHCRYIGPAWDYPQNKNISNYITTGSGMVLAWSPTSCSNNYDAICEIPTSNYQCPPSPPASPPPPMDIINACPPADNDTFWCPSYMSTCFSLRTTTATFYVAQTTCAAAQGKLVSWQTASKQLDLETYFRATGQLTATGTYWMGLYKGPLYWYYWADGSPVNNGEVSNESPYAHWWVGCSNRFDCAAARNLHCAIWISMFRSLFLPCQQQSIATQTFQIGQGTRVWGRSKLAAQIWNRKVVRNTPWRVSVFS